MFIKTVYLQYYFSTLHNIFIYTHTHIHINACVFVYIYIYYAQKNNNFKRNFLFYIKYQVLQK